MFGKSSPSSKRFTALDFAVGAAAERCSEMSPEPRTESSAGTVAAVGCRCQIGADVWAIAVPCMRQIIAAPMAVAFRLLRMTFSITALCHHSSLCRSVVLPSSLLNCLEIKRPFEE
jgi:hypothetical protein